MRPLTFLITLVSLSFALPAFALNPKGNSTPDPLGLSLHGAPAKKRLRQELEEKKIVSRVIACHLELPRSTKIEAAEPACEYLSPVYRPGSDPAGGNIVGAQFLDRALSEKEIRDAFQSRWVVWGGCCAKAVKPDETAVLQRAGQLLAQICGEKAEAEYLAENPGAVPPQFKGFQIRASTLQQLKGILLKDCSKPLPTLDCDEVPGEKPAAPV